MIKVKRQLHHKLLKVNHVCENSKSTNTKHSKFMWAIKYRSQERNKCT